MLFNFFVRLFPQPSAAPRAVTHLCWHTMLQVHLNILIRLPETLLLPTFPGAGRPIVQCYSLLFLFQRQHSALPRNLNKWTLLSRFNYFYQSLSSHPAHNSLYPMGQFSAWIIPVILCLLRINTFHNYFIYLFSYIWLEKGGGWICCLFTFWRGCNCLLFYS